MSRPLLTRLAALLRTMLICVALTLVAAAPARAQTPLEAGLSALRLGDAAATRVAIGAAPDALARDILMWHLLRERKGTFAEAEDFLARNPDWPGLDLLHARVELDLPVTTPPDRVIAFFAGEPPQSAAGAFILALAYRAQGRDTDAEVTAIDAWLSLPMPPSTEAAYLDVFGDLLRPFDSIRLDALTWAGEIGSAEQAAVRVSGPEAALARARLALRDGRGGVDRLIEAVPSQWRGHQGLAYERFRWRLDRSRIDGPDGALALLFAYDESADTLGNPVAWGQHRARLARGLMQEGRPEDAYRVAAEHHLPEGDAEIADLEWLAGYIALRFQDRPEDAVAHFRRFDTNVGSPISKGRGGYWLGRALEATGDAGGAAAAYALGARYQTSFYGQLAAERAGLPADPLLAGTESFPPLAETALADSSVLAAGRLLASIGERSMSERFLTHLAEGKPRAEIGALIDMTLDELDDPHVALLIAKRAAQEGHELNRGYFPVTELAAFDSAVAPELTLSIARRESEFDPVVVSEAGASGLMQIMPGTAREMSRLVGEPYREAALTREPLYNATLGTTYLRQLEVDFGFSPVLVPAAYNAGPSRARRWSAEFGDPRAEDVDVVDWIEDVPFSETRNYIMRVAESLAPYRARLSGEAGPPRLSRWLKSGYGELAPASN